MPNVTPTQRVHAGLTLILKETEELDPDRRATINQAGVGILEALERLESRPALLIPDWMIIDAFRYAVGRATYQVSVTTRWLIDNWGDFSEHVQHFIRRDLEEAFARAERSGGTIGMACDHEDWERVRALWTEGSGR